MVKFFKKKIGNKKEFIIKKKLFYLYSQPPKKKKITFLYFKFLINNKKNYFTRSFLEWFKVFCKRCIKKYNVQFSNSKIFQIADFRSIPLSSSFNVHLKNNNTWLWFLPSTAEHENDLNSKVQCIAIILWMW